MGTVTTEPTTERATEPDTPAPQLAPDQERRLRQQHKKRTAELGRVQKDGKEAALLVTLQAQAQRGEKAQREAAANEKVATAGLAAAEAELASARKKSSVLEALATDLHARQKALLAKKHAQLAREDEHREQLAASFRDKIGAIQLKLEQIGEQRAVQTAESVRLRDELEAFTDEHAASEARHAAALLGFDAAEQALALELEGSSAQLEAARSREGELSAEMASSRSAEEKEQAALSEHGKAVSQFQQELSESNAQFGTHKATLAAASEHLAQAEKARGPLKALKRAEAEFARRHKAAAEELQAEADKLTAHVGRLNAVCSALRRELHGEGGEGGEGAEGGEGREGGAGDAEGGGAEPACRDLD